MPLRHKYIEYESSKRLVFTRIDNISVFLALLFIVVNLRYILNHITHSDHPKGFIHILCTLFPLLSALATLFLLRRKNQQGWLPITGNSSMCNHLLWLKMANFGILVSWLILVMEEGVREEWVLKIVWVVYAILQLILAQALEGIWLKIVRARTAFS